MTANFSKDPEAVLDYQLDWSSWLPAGDTIATSTWVVPVGITKNSDTKDATTTTIWLSGGTEGTLYQLVNRVVTTEGRTEDQTVVVMITSR